MTSGVIVTSEGSRLVPDGEAGEALFERHMFLMPAVGSAPVLIRQANLKGKDYRVDWVYLKLNDPERETIICKDPFQSHDARVERLIQSF